VINGMIISSVGAAGVYIYRKTKKRETAAKIANEIVPTSTIDRDEMVLANEIYQGKPSKKMRYPRYDINPTEYQYLLFESRREVRF